MTCGELHDRLFAYVLGALSPEEKAACEAHLALPAHDGCLEALRRATDAVALLAEALPPRPPPEAVWAAIVERIEPRASAPASAPAPAAALVATAAAEGQPAAAPPAPPDALASRRQARSSIGWALAAAAMLGVVFLGWERFRWAERTRKLEQQMAQSEKRFRELEAAAVSARGLEGAVKQCQVEVKELRDDVAMRREAWKLFEKPGSRLVTLAPKRGTRAQATAVVNGEEKRGLLWASGLEPMPKHDYTLWWVRGADLRPAGLLRADAKGDVVVRLDEKLRTQGIPDGLAVTLEPKGGMPSPTGPVLLSGSAR